MGTVRQTAAAHHFGITGRPRESRWPSVVVSLALTLAMFAVAITSMRRVPRWLSARSVEHEKPVTVRFEPPPPVPVRPRPRTQRRPGAPTVPVPAPPTTPQPVAPVNAPVRPLDVAPPAAQRDSGTADERPADRPGNRPSAPAPAAPRGAPIAPSGVSRIIAPPAVQAHRDSVADSVRAATFRARMNEPLSAETKQMLGESQRIAAKVARRATTAGNGADVHIMQGEGKDGVGAVGGSGLGSVGLPLFSKGPSAAQRRKNDSIDADYRARLGRLQELIKRRRDSLLADSLRRDSLARLRRP